MRLVCGGAYTVWHSVRGNGALPVLRRTAMSKKRDYHNPNNPPMPSFTHSAAGPGLICSRTYGTSFDSSGPSTEPDAEVLATTRNRICTIKFNRPHKRNAVNLNMARRFLTALQEADTSNDVTLITLTGVGSYFSSGIDLVGFAGPKPAASADAGPAQAPFKFNDLFATLNSVKKPLIACINGPAVGFAVTMLGLFDSVYASDSATFQTHFTRFGLPPEFSSTYTFPRIMGYSRANQILLFCQKASAQEAYDAGLVSCIFPSATFREEVERKLEEMASLPVKSLVYTKELVRGRDTQLRSEVSDKEQSYFDPSVARDVKKSFKSRVN